MISGLPYNEEEQRTDDKLGESIRNYMNEMQKRWILGIGEIVKTLINTERDTLGTVQRLCRSMYCLNAKHRSELLEMIENGEITTAAEGIEMAKRLRKPMQMCR